MAGIIESIILIAIGVFIIWVSSRVPSPEILRTILIIVGGIMIIVGIIFLILALVGAPLYLT